MKQYKIKMGIEYWEQKVKEYSSLQRKDDENTDFWARGRLGLAVGCLNQWKLKQKQEMIK